MLILWDVTSCSLATVTGMLQACSAFVCKFKLFKARCIVSASSETIAQWHRVVPQTNGKIQVRSFAMTCAPCPHEYITGPLFGPTHFLKIILILSCPLPSDFLPSCCLTNFSLFLFVRSLAFASVQNPNLLRVLEGSAHSTSFLFRWPRMNTFAHFQQIGSVIRVNILMRSSLILAGRVTFRACVPCDLVTAHPVCVQMFSVC
jgi:hypothetical protein